MQVLKRGALWGAVIGIVVGILGIDIKVPYSYQWQWLHPAGFYTLSIVLLGSFGTVVGWLAEQIIRRSPHKTFLWITAVLSLALAIGTISLYRSQILIRQAFWQPPTVGLVEVSRIQDDLQPGHPHKEYRQAGVLMGIVGADIVAPQQMASSLGVSVNFNSLAFALNQAGIKVATDPNRANVAAARKLCAAVVHWMDHDWRRDKAPGITPEVVSQVMRQMAHRVPANDQWGWAQ